MDFKYFAKSAKGLVQVDKVECSEGLDCMDVLESVSEVLHEMYDEQLEKNNDYIESIEVWDVEH